jgi:hypothetical protein
MALTRKSLKAMGLTDEQVDSIIEMHTDTVDGLKADVTKYRADAEKLPGVQKELDDLKAKGDDGWKDKHDKLKSEYEKYKGDVESKAARTAKEAAVRAFFESKGITGKNLDIAMRGIRSDLDGYELDGEKIKDTKTLEDLVKGDYAGLVITTSTSGAHTANPPASNGGGTGKTREEILGIKDGTARRAEMMKNTHLFPEISAAMHKTE